MDDESLNTRKHSGQYAGKTAAARSRERHNKLIEAGIYLIGRNGYSATSIDAVCTEAGLTKRYFYEAFANREELLTAAYKSVTQEFVNAIMQQAAPHLDDSRALVHAGLVGTFGYVVNNPNKGRLMMVEATSVRSQLGTVYGEGYEEFVNLLVGFTTPFIDNNDVSEKQLRVLAKGVIGAIIHLCQSWIATDFKQPVEELIDGTEMILGGIGMQLGIAGWVQTSAKPPTKT